MVDRRERDLDVDLTLGLSNDPINDPQVENADNDEDDDNEVEIEDEEQGAFPWSMNTPAKIHSIGYLIAHDIRNIKGTMICKKCNFTETIEYDLLQKFEEVKRIFKEKIHNMNDRAPKEWMYPELKICRSCGSENSVKPEVDSVEENINWLFLLLGQQLGFCTLGQLKFFCQHTDNHRTGAKNRVLYLTYLTLCRQLGFDPLKN